MFNIFIIIENVDSVSIGIDPLFKLWSTCDFIQVISDKLSGVLHYLPSTTSNIRIPCNLETITYRGNYHNGFASYLPTWNITYSNVTYSGLKSQCYNAYWAIYLHILRLVGYKAFHLSWLALIFLLYYLIYPFFGPSANIIGRSLGQRGILGLFASLGNLLFVLLGWLYDFLSTKFRIRNNLFFNNIFLTKVILGIVYLGYILIGVCASNGVYFLINKEGSIYDKNKILLMICSFIGTIAFSSLWFWLRTPGLDLQYDLINSFFRSLAECFSFNFISYGTYVSWFAWTRLSNHVNLGIAIGTPLHLLTSQIAIWLESYSQRFYIYGPFYLISFIFVNLSTNSFFHFVSQVTNNVNLFHAIMISVCGISVSFFTPNVYRNNVRLPSPIELQNLNRRGLAQPNNVENNRNRLWYVIRSSIAYYLLVISFVVLSGIVWSYII